MSEMDVTVEAKIERIALAITRAGDAASSVALAHATLIAASEVLAACEGPIGAAEACYRLADFYACMKVER